jgi:sigma-B regulation protein RsbU (phosphoserine phosphatase)
VKHPELAIRTSDGASRIYPLGAVSVSVGRSSANDLCFPDDTGLSRRHLVFEPEGGEWTVRDLGSKNGTLVNSERIAGRRVLRPGDWVEAGHLTIEYRVEGRILETGSVTFVDAAEASVPFTGAVVTSLDSQSSAIQALLRAGQELAGQRPLNELFPLILNLAVEAVGASRGVLLTLENGELVPRAARGADFRISTAVRDRILREKASLLVRDAQFDEAFRERRSIVEQQVRSMMAAPLQTENRVTGLIYVDMPNIVHPFTEEELNLLTVMANVAAIRIEQARLTEIEQAQRILERELAQAAEIQRSLLPAAPPQTPGFELAGRTEPCRGVGGDYFDFLRYPDGRIALLVGDVAGKGLSAALLMSSLQARVQVLAESGDAPAAVVARLNRSLAGACPSNRFVTFFYSVLDPASGELRYSNAGHNPPLLIRSDGSVERLEAGGTVLGILPGWNYDERSVVMEPGDMLALYSDGITEACPPESDDEFGTVRLAESLAAHRAEPVAATLEGAFRAVAQWSGGAPAADDATLVVARRLSASPSA